VSLLIEAFAVPSRVKGAAQLLVQERGQRVKRETAEALLSPSSLKGDDGQRDNRAMVRRTIDECIGLRLFLEQDDFLLLNPDLPNGAQHPDTIQGALPGVLLDLVLDPSNDENRNLGEALAWFLGQDVLRAPATWSEFGAALREREGFAILEFNDVRYANFAYWARYLGLANVIMLPNRATSEGHLLPDPTECLRRVLAEVFADQSQLTVTDCLRRVSARCSLFEGGALRDSMARHLPVREARHLSSTTSFALLRLEEEDTLRMQMHSDADKVILVVGSFRRDVSEITWMRGSRDTT